MQYDVITQDVYNERTSKDGKFEYVLNGNRKTNRYNVTCWQGVVCHWQVHFTDETKALAEFNRFE